MAKKESSEVPKKQKTVAKKRSAKKTAPKKAAAKKTVSKKITSRNETYMPNLKKKYKDEIVSALMKRFDYKNVMEVPHISVISLNMGIGDAKPLKN